MKYLMILIAALTITSNAYSEECDDDTRARMIKSGISDEVIEKHCDNSQSDEDTIISKKLDNEPIISQKDEKKSEEAGRFRISLLGGAGKFSLKTNDELDGDYDHSLSSTYFAFSYHRTNKQKLHYGGGWQTFTAFDRDWQHSSSYVSGYWTYTHPSYGDFIAKLIVDDFRSNFIYGFIGYEIDDGSKLFFQPNVKLGLKTLSARWKEHIIWRTRTNTAYTYTLDTSGFGLEIDFPLLYKSSETFSWGGNICLCSNTLSGYVGSYQYNFYSSKIISLLLERKL